MEVASHSIPHPEKVARGEGGDEGGREEGREERRKGGRKGRKEGEREGKREGGREGGREGETAMQTLRPQGFRDTHIPHAPFVLLFISSPAGGEDAHFISDWDVGVFDGVGGWSVVVREGGRGGGREGGRGGREGREGGGMRVGYATNGDLEVVFQTSIDITPPLPSDPAAPAPPPPRRPPLPPPPPPSPPPSLAPF
jgi:hypothetical protein